MNDNTVDGQRRADGSLDGRRNFVRLDRVELRSNEGNQLYRGM